MDTPLGPTLAGGTGDGEDEIEGAKLVIGAEVVLGADDKEGVFLLVGI